MENAPESPDDQAIRLGLEQAMAEQRVITDEVARRIAAQLHTGQTSAMYSLASCGAVDYDRLSAEMRQETATEQDPRIRGMYSFLGLYAEANAGREPIANWYELTADPPDAPEQATYRPEVEVWLGCLASYNDGVLHGKWTDAAVSVDDLNEVVQEVLASSPIEGAEEHYIGDISGFHGVRFDQYASLETISRVAMGIEEHGEAFARYVGYHGVGNLDYAETSFEDAYVGRYSDEQEAANEILESAGAFDALESARNEVGETYRDYLTVDVDSFARDQPDHLFIDGRESGVYVFRDI